VEKFQEVRKRALELMPKLGPSFEEEKEETVQAGNERNLDRKGKREQQDNLETMEELET
jgi:hypothetical protein